MTFGKVVAAVIVGIFATALIVHLFAAPCMLSIGGTCLARGDAPVVSFLKALDHPVPAPPAAVAAPRTPDYVPITQEELDNCGNRECIQNLCEIAAQHGQFANVDQCTTAQAPFADSSAPPASGGSWAPPAAAADK